MQREASRALAFIRRADFWLPKVVVAPSFAASLFFVYGFIAWTVVISFTRPAVLPRCEWAGFVP